MQKQITLKSQKTMALQLLRRTQYMEALDRFRIIIQQDPDCFADILTTLYKQLIMDYSNLHLRTMISDLLISHHFYADAFDEIEDMIDLDPNFSQAYFLLGKLFNKTPDMPCIQELLEHAFHIGIKDQVILDILPKLYLAKNDHEKSISFYTLLLEQDRKNTTLLNTLAELYVKTRQYTLATQTYEQIAGISPNLCGDLAKKCESILKMCPMNISLRQNIVSFYFKACQTENAVAHIKELCRIDPTYKPQAIKVLEEKLNTFPENPDIYIFLADLKIEISSFSDAIVYLKKLYKSGVEPEKSIVPVLQKILDRFPEQVIAHQFFVDIYLNERDFSRCLDHIETLIQLEQDGSYDLETRIRRVKNADPEYIDRSKLVLAKLMHRENRAEECRLMCDSLQDTSFEIEATILKATLSDADSIDATYASLLQLVHLHPFSYDVHQAIQEKCHMALNEHLHTCTDPFQKGTLYLRSGQLLAAIEQFQNVLPETSLYFSAQAMTARCFLELGRFQMTQNVCSRLIAQLTYQDRDFLNQIRFIYACALAHMYHYKSAMTQLDSILQDDIKFPFAKSLLGTLQQLPMRTHKGLALIGILTAKGDVVPFAVPNPDELSRSNSPETLSFGHAHNEQGVELFIKQNLRGAHDELDIAYQMDPSLSCILTNLALVALAKKESEKAAAYLAQAKEKNPDYGLIPFIEGLYHQQKGSYNEAIKQYHASIQKYDKLPLAYLNLGDCFFALKNIERAHHYWEKAKSFGHYAFLIQSRTHYLQPLKLSHSYWLNPQNAQLVQDL